MLLENVYNFNEGGEWDIYMQNISLFEYTYTKQYTQSR